MASSTPFALQSLQRLRIVFLKSPQLPTTSGVELPQRKDPYTIGPVVPSTYMSPPPEAGVEFSRKLHSKKKAGATFAYTAPPRSLPVLETKSQVAKFGCELPVK